MKKFLSIMACLAFVLVGGIALSACCDQTKTMTEEDFLAAIAQEEEVKLTGNLNLTEKVTVSKTLTIDLNGFNITEEITYEKDVKNTLFKIVDNGNLTIKGKGSIVSDDLYIFKIDGTTKENAKLTIEDGSYQASCSVVYAKKGTAEIKGGSYKIVNAEHPDYVKHMLNTQDPNENATITVSGGTFYGFNPADTQNDAKVKQGFKVSPDETTSDKEKTYTVSAE